MTKFMIPALGWIYLVIVLDWYTKKVVGWDVSLRSRSGEWKQALEMGIQKEFPQGVKDRGLKLISDNGSQPTSVSFMRDMGTLGIEQIFTSYDNPQGNAETERMMRTIKEELLWLHEFSSLEEAKLFVTGLRWTTISFTFIQPWDISVRKNLSLSMGVNFLFERRLEGHAEIWVGLRKSIVRQMVRPFFDD